VFRYRKKIDHDADDLRRRLKDLVAEQIKKHRQPDNASIRLSSRTDMPNYIFGGTAAFGTFLVIPKNTSAMFCYKNIGTEEYTVVTNIESQNLIASAITPLDLKWRLSNANIMVSWDHWPQK
jgi:hypothetical protein